MKSVVISGYSGGMGQESAKKFSQNGYFVFGLDIKEPKVILENTKFIKTDLRDMDSLKKAFDIVSKETNELDLIINMAGIYDFNSLIEMSEEEFMRIFDINVFSIYRMNKTFLPLLKKKGKIIIVSSELAPLDPLPFTGIYAMTKTTIEKYAYSLRMELQLLDYQVSVIRPGAVDTTLLDVSTNRVDHFTESTELYKDSSQRFKRVINTVEARKIPPMKIANLAYKIANKKKPRYIYKINRNPLLLMLNILPDRLQNYIIRKILTKKHKA